MHMISVHLNTLKYEKYKYKSKIFELIKSNYRSIDNILDPLPNWALSTTLCLQIDNENYNFELHTFQFMKNLKKQLSPYKF